MKTEVKKELVETMRRLGDQQMSAFKQYEVQNMICHILRRENPKKKIGLSSGEEVDNFLIYSGLKQVDFPIPGFKPELKWSSGYKHATPGSIIHNMYEGTKPRQRVTFGEMADIIEQYVN